MPNPLIPEILSLLHDHPLGISEHGVLQALGAHSVFATIDDGGQLYLFQKHFLVMNALYQLQQCLWEEEQLALEISPLCIRLTASGPTDAGNVQALTESPALRDYYLDWKNLEETTEADVQELLEAFWRRFTNAEGRGNALEVLNLEQDASGNSVTHRYRELAAKHHPDKGGDPEIFIRIRQAYETLRDI